MADMYTLKERYSTAWISYYLGVILCLGCSRNPAGLLPSTPSAEKPTGATPLTWTTLASGIEAAPLSPRTPADATRFESLSVGRTGIDFAHNWTPPPDYKLGIGYHMPGGGVCTGDYDGDGWPDVFLTQPNVGSRLYRNLGGFRFEDVTSSTVGDSPHGQGATFVDIDNDSDLDLFVCNDEQPNQLFVNDGQGGFREQAAEFGLDFSGASVMMTFADYDRDGDLDGYLVTYRTEVDVTVPRPQQRPDGSFEIATEHRELVDVIIPADGKPRIIKAAQYDHLYRNNGDEPSRM